MPDLHVFQFAHRPNVNGTFDSICKECFKTVVRSEKEADLHLREDGHVCGGEAIEFRDFLRRQLENREH